MDAIKQEKNRGYVIAGGAAIIAFIAFFLPYVSVSSAFGNGSANGASGGSWLWLEFLTTLVVIGITAVFVFRTTPPSLSSTMPVDKQIKIAKYVLLGSSVLALLVHLLFLLGFSSYTASYTSEGYSGLGISLGFGFWLFFLAVIGMIVGSAMALRLPTVGMASPYGQQNMVPPAPYGQPPTLYPSSPYQQQPYDPYQQSAQPYSPYQQPYTIGEQQLQQPYDPYQQQQQYPPAPPTELQPPPPQF